MIPPNSPGVPPGHQICSNCSQVKPLEEFYLRPTPNDPNHRHRQCKACQRAKGHERYVAHPENHAQAQARTQAYWAKAGDAKHEQRRATHRAAHAQALRGAGRAYQPRLRARKDSALTPEEIRQLVRDALAELDRAELFASGFMQGSRAAGKESDLNMLLAPLARAVSALRQILPRHALPNPLPATRQELRLSRKKDRPRPRGS